MDNILKHPEFDSIAGQYESGLGLPSGILRSLIYQESRGNPSALSPKGAMGVAQFMPATAKAYGVDAKDPWDSLRGAAEYLGDSLKKYGSVDAALAEYNGGPRQANRVVAGQAPAALETRNYISEVKGRLSQGDQAVMRSAAKGDNLAQQVQALRDAGFKDWIADAKQQGATNEEIVQQLASQGQAVGQAAHDRRAQEGALSTAWEGVKDVGQRVARGAQQIVADGDELKALQDQEAADRADPDKIALRSSTAAQVGSAAPLVASAFIPGVNGVVGGSALAGTLAALQPTVEGESRLQNTAVGAATGGAGVLAGRALGGAINASVRGAQAGLRGGRTVQEVRDTISALEREGIPVSARDLSPTLNRVANQAESTLGGKIGQADAASAQEAAIARAITRRMGQEADSLDSAYIADAQKRIGGQFDSALNGVTVDGARFGTTLDDVIAAQKNGLPSLSSSFPGKVAQDLKDKLAAGPMSAVELQGIRSQIGRELANPGLEAGARKGLGDLNASITQAIEGSMPKANAEAWKVANQQWRNLQAAENLVRATNDTGEITARRLASAIKQGKFRGSYERGEAPYQDLQKSLSEMQTGRQGLLGSSLDAGAVQALGAYATGGMSLPAAGITANLALRLLNSPNPQIRALLLGLTPVKQAELRRMALAGAITQVGYQGDKK